MLREKLKTKQAKIGVIGLGYVGLPLAVEFARKGLVLQALTLILKKYGRLIRECLILLMLKEVLSVILSRNGS